MLHAEACRVKFRNSISGQDIELPDRSYAIGSMKVSEAKKLKWPGAPQAVDFLLSPESLRVVGLSANSIANEPLSDAMPVGFGQAENSASELH